MQAPMFDGLSLDPFPLFDDGAGPAEVGVGWRHVVQALVVMLVVVVLDEGLDLGLDVLRQFARDIAGRLEKLWRLQVGFDSLRRRCVGGGDSRAAGFL